MADRIRIEIDVAKKESREVLLSGTPKVWKASGLNVEIGILYNEAIRSIGDVSAITVLLKKESKLGAAVYEKTTTMNTALTLEEWQAGTLYHALAEFSAEEMALDLDAKDSKTFWMSVYGIDSTTLKPVMFGGLSIIVLESGINLNSSGPTQGSNLVPPGAVYNGSGQYVLACTADVLHSYTKNANDTSISDGTTTISATGFITPSTASMTLTGTAGQSVTAVIRYPVYLSADQTRSLMGTGIIREVNASGVSILLVNGTKAVRLACDDNKQLSTTPIDL